MRNKLQEVDKKNMHRYHYKAYILYINNKNKHKSYVKENR